MRTLLTFTGSIVYFVVMTIISPLLAIVYAGIHTTRYLQSVQWQRPTLPTVHMPSVQLSAKKQWHLLWQKALRLH